MTPLDLVTPLAAPWRTGARVARSARPGDGALLRHYAGDLRSVLEGTSIGLLQLMYPPLGAAVAAQSGFFDDPYGRIYRSIPQIWATVLAPDAAERARGIRDLHRGIKGTSGSQRYSALEPETFWWAHATFTHLIFRSVERYHPADDLDTAGHEHLYADTVAWYESYGVSMRPVPGSLAEFRATFDRYCHERLERTPAVARLVESTEDGTTTRPVPTNPLQRVVAARLEKYGRLNTVGNLPAVARERLGFTWSDEEQASLDRMATTLRWTFESMPPALNRSVFTGALRRTGSRTRAERYRPDHVAA